MARTPLILLAFALAGGACSTTGTAGDSSAESATREMRVNLADVMFATEPDAELLNASYADEPRFLHVDLGRRGVIRELEFVRLSVEATGRTWAAAKWDVGTCWRAADEAQTNLERPGAIIDTIASNVDLGRLKTCLSEKGYAGVLLSKPAHYDNGPFGAARPTPAPVTVAQAEVDAGPREAALGAPIKTSDAYKAAMAPRAIGLRTAEGGALPARAAAVSANVAEGGGGADALPAWDGLFTTRVESASARLAENAAGGSSAGFGEVHIDVAVSSAVEPREPESSAYALARQTADLDRFLLLAARGAPRETAAAAPWAEPLPAPMQLAGTDVEIAARPVRPLPPLVEEATEESPIEPVAAPAPMRLAAADAAVAADAAARRPLPPLVEEATEESPIVAVAEPVRLAAEPAPAQPAPPRIDEAWEESPAEPVAAPAPVRLAAADAESAAVVMAETVAESVAPEPEEPVEAEAAAPAPAPKSALPTLDELLKETPAAPRDHGAVVFVPLGD